MKIKLLKFKSVKSTNDTALRLIKIKYSKPTIVNSLKQTSGRGTMGKKWISKKGNLFFTIFFELNQKKINFKHFAILNAYLIRRIISKEFKSKIKIKWPNDLLFSKKKICGILQETITCEKKKFLIVGMGINTNFDPNIKSFSSTCLKYIINRNIDNNKLLYIIKKKYEKFLIKTQKYSYLELIKYTNKA
jgi:BirA family biotin operon repressor/biotin-[acetyl-CoA-carboxylase] ligase